MQDIVTRIEERRRLGRQQEGVFFVDRVDLLECVLELEEKQAAEVRGWRLRQGLLLAFPILLASLAVGWLGFQLVRRQHLPGTIFQVEEAASRNTALPPSSVATEAIQVQAPAARPADTDDNVACLGCGKTFPAEASKCPTCGWSYLKS